MINVYIDESGSFVQSETRGSWNLSAALVIPTPELRKCKEALRKLKVKSGKVHSEEIKLKHVLEKDYLQFLTELSKTNCTLYSVITDAGAQTVSEIEFHRNSQAGKIEEHKEKMLNNKGVAAIEQLANQVRALSPQLHLQLMCQIELIADVLSKSILYYVQRIPSQLNGFLWRVDEKASGLSNFEKTFKTVIPPMLQSKSLEEPLIQVAEFDYSAMKDFVYSKESAPTYLKEIYGIESNNDGGLNLGKLVWDDFEFVDSKKDLGVQIVDLLASGIRRILRGGFSNSTAISKSLGRLMVQTINNGDPIHFITLSNDEFITDDSVFEALQLFKSTQNSMFCL